MGEVDSHSAKTVRNTAILPSVVCAGITSAVVLLAGLADRFHVGSNDFWGNLFLAETAEFHNPASFFNGFFPAGYTLVVKLMSGSSPDVTMFLLNAAFSGVMVGATTYRFRNAVKVSPFVVISLGMIAFHPLFRRMITTGPDLGAGVLAFLGWIILLSSDDSRFVGSRKSVLLAAGLFWGLASLFRYHALAFGVLSVIGWSAFQSGQRARTFLFLIVGMLAACCPQMIVSLLSGRGIYSTDQVFNVYKMVHGIDWESVDASAVPNSISAIFLESPARFLSRWVSVFLGMLPIVVPILLAGLCASTARLRMVFRVLTAVGILYCLTISLGDRGSGDALVLPWTVLGGVVTADYMLRNSSGYSRLFRVWVWAGMLLFALAGVNRDIALVRAWRSDNTLFRQTEALVRRSVRLSIPKEVFATDFKLYFPGLPTGAPYTNGGWLRVGSAFDRKYPNLSVDNPRSFLGDCRLQGIKCLALTDQAAEFGPGPSEILHNMHSFSGVRYVGTSGRFRVFRIDSSYNAGSF